MQSKEITISKQTLGIIKSIRAIIDHWEQTHEAITSLLGDNKACEVMTKEYSIPFSEIIEMLDKRLLESITENINNKEFTEI